MEPIGKPPLQLPASVGFRFICLLNQAIAVENELQAPTSGLRNALPNLHPSRGKTGKSALFQRLYNIIFNKNEGVIPFYFEIIETDRWIVDFAKDFFLTFLSQYIAFKIRDKGHMSLDSFKSVRAVCEKYGFHFLLNRIESFQETIDSLVIVFGNFTWSVPRDVPHQIDAFLLG